ncbi:MFS general substrate transporter [Marasmius fiardii PR-910]|nr:MFS general substrate transporter [Marasmius fiardii PR-910]
MNTITPERDVEKCENKSELRPVELPQKPEVPALPYDERDSSDTWPNTITSSTSASSRTPLLTSLNRNALLTTFGGFLALLSGFGQLNAFGTFQTYYAAHQLQAYSPSKISWIGSLQLWVFFFSGWGIGWLFDIYGPTRLLFTGAVCCSVGMVLTSFATKYYQLLLCQGVLFGLGVGLLFYPSLASISSHFVKYRATALGICAAGSSVGGVVFPIILQQLYITVGFGWAVRIVGLISGTLCLISVLTVTTNPPAASLHENRTPARTCDDREGRWKLMKIMSPRDFRFVLLAIGSCFVALGLFTPFFYIVEYTSHISPDSEAKSTHFLTLATLNCGGILGRIAPCFLSDHIGHFNLLTPSAFLSGILTLACWLNAKSMTGVMIYTVLYGFSSGAFIAVITPCVVQITEDKTQVGRRMGGLYSVISIPALIGTPIAGALLGSSSSNSFTGLIVYSGTTVIVGSVFILLAKLAVEPRLFSRV